MERQWVMGSRTLKDFEVHPYFEKGDETPGTDTGTRDMYPLAPFVVSGGRNTERYYFTHINDLTDYKFNIRPRYFGDESDYVKKFPLRVHDILEKNADAVVFCVYDMDAIYRDGLLERHEEFVASLKEEIAKGNVILCPSMPSFEYWLLLHFINYTSYLRDFPRVAGELAPYLKPYFPLPSSSFKKLLKSEKHLKDPVWVEKLLEDDKLKLATERARLIHQQMASSGDISEKSYTLVYLIFEYLENSLS